MSCRLLPITSLNQRRSSPSIPLEVGRPHGPFDPCFLGLQCSEDSGEIQEFLDQGHFTLGLPEHTISLRSSHLPDHLLAAFLEILDDFLPRHHVVSHYMLPGIPIWGWP